ncbi:MAG: hypothetical protein PHN39_04250 [Candidatus Pacebacteria bacterium]|nr:hypothetical protein [Candidatus Paceibacterota bacterium]
MTWFYFRYWDDVVTLQPMATNLLILRNLVLIALFLVGLYKLIKGKKGKNETRNFESDSAGGDEETRQPSSSFDKMSFKKISRSNRGRKDMVGK